MSHAKSDLHFGDFRIDSSDKVLFLNDAAVALPPKAVDVLLVLVERAGHVVEKNELMAAVWPDVFVEEGNLTQYVFLLRQALGTRPDGGAYIETIPRRGYRFVAPVSSGGHLRGATSTPDSLERRAWWKWAAAVVAVPALLSGVWRRELPVPIGPRPSEWVRLTAFADSVTQPALSPDGRLLAFLRGPGTFTTAGQLWIKALPDGEPVQLTDDEHLKMGPAFSPDGSRITYTVPWDTWEVATHRGTPRRWLPNASGLSWIDARQILFSEITRGLHMAVMTASSDRARARTLYAPTELTRMAHRSRLSPDRRSLLVVEMDTPPVSWRPCRLVTLAGTSPDREVGPPRSRCTSAAWSPDGQWMYLAADAGSGFHLWRQPFPTGAPEQLTFGPTEEEGLVVTPDGGSLITSVGLRHSSVWISDAGRERQVSAEGHASQPQFSPDGATLYFLRRSQAAVAGPDDELGTTGLWAADFETGRLEHLFERFDLQAFALSDDGRTVAFRARRDGDTALWLAPIDRRSAPRELMSSSGFRGSGLRLVGDFVVFAEDGDDGLVSIYRFNIRDGGKERIVSNVNGALGVSPDGRWIVVAVADRHPRRSVASVAYGLDGAPPIVICAALCTVKWGTGGQYFYVSFLRAGDAGLSRTVVAPLSAGQALPRLPPEGLRSPEQAAQLPGWFAIEQPEHIVPGPTPSRYAFTRQVVHRNLYQIPVP